MNESSSIQEVETAASISQTPAKWIRIPDVIRIYGLSRTKCFALAKEGKVTSVSLREPGMARATRLFCASSLDSYIESFLPKAKEGMK